MHKHNEVTPHNLDLISAPSSDLLNLMKLLISTWIFLLSLPLFAQSKLQNSARYTTPLDQKLTVRSIAILPVTDNVNGIYARPIEEKLKELLKQNHQFDLVVPSVAGSLNTPQSLERSVSKVKKIANGIKADTLLVARATKAPDGFSLHMDLFLKDDGKLLAQQITRQQKYFDTKNIQKNTAKLLQKLLTQLPFEGMVLSRTNNLVTVNLGSNNGVKKGQVLTAVTLLNLNRHPKYHFIVSSEKEILGKIRLTKVEKTLSFGKIISEKERNVIGKDSKIAGIDFVMYDDPGSPSPNQPMNPTQEFAFGKAPQEWKPAKPPTFGKVHVGLGLGTYRYNTKLRSSGPVEASGFHPSIQLGAEVWLTSRWQMDFLIHQGVLSVDNPKIGGTASPEELSVNTSQLAFAIGYNLLLQEDFFGPKITASLGFSNFSTYVDASTPTTFTETKYSGMYLGIKGSLPLTNARTWYGGAELQFHITDSLDEQPYTSGASSDDSINRFSIFAIRHINTRMRIKGSLDFNLYSSSFTGDGTRTDDAENASQKLTTFVTSLEYLF